MSTTRARKSCFPWFRVSSCANSSACFSSRSANFHIRRARSDGASFRHGPLSNAARAAFDRGPWRKLAPSERARLMWKLADLLEKHAEEFAQLETLNQGKQLFLARVVDIPTSIDQLRYY